MTRRIELMCERCGKKDFNHKGWRKFNVYGYKPMHDPDDQQPTYQEMDYCPDCVKAFTAFMKRTP